MRRMLTDKLTKSIKEVVNAYNEGEFSAVTANPATTTETLTAIEINGTGYAVSGGSGSVDIDNKTIIKNENDELETAVGGWKEVQTITLDDVLIPTNPNYNEYDLGDEDLATELFSVLKPNTRYDVEVTFTDVTGIDPADIDHCYIYSTRENGGRKFGGDDCLYIVKTDTSEVAIEFYVDLDQQYDDENGRLHIYGGNQNIRPNYGSQNASIKIEFGTFEQTVYHKIKDEYIDNHEFTLSGSYVQVSDNQMDYILANLHSMKFIYDNKMFTFDRSSGDTHYFRNDEVTRVLENNKINDQYIVVYSANNEIYYNNEDKSGVITDNATILFGNKIKTAIGGGYSDADVATTTSDYTLVGTEYTCSNDNFIKGILGSIINATTVWRSGDAFVKFKNSNNENREEFVNMSYSEADGIWNIEFTNSNVFTSGTSFTYNANTNEVTNRSGLTFSPDFYAKVGTDIAAVVVEYPQFTKIITTVDPKFLPGFNVAPTAAGTYVLKATVDAQGNITYTWVAEV